MFPDAVRRVLAASAVKQPALNCGEATRLRRTHQVGHEHRSRGRVWSVIAAAAAAVAAVLCVAGPAHAAWREAPVPLSATDQVAAVSCAQQCVAVGSTANGLPFALHSTTQGWTREPMPLPPRHPRLLRLPPAAYFRDVSCTSPQMCVAVGSDQCLAGLIERWNGHRWAIQQVGPRCSGRIPYFGVSCVSAHWCLVLARVPELWNGRHWATAGRVRLDLGRIACVAVRVCVFAGESGYEAVVGNWDARGPHTRNWGQEPGIPSHFTDVSCMSPRSCLAVGNVGSATAIVRWTGRRWVNAVLPTPSTYLQTVACTAKSCITFDYQMSSNVWTWNGRSWSEPATWITTPFPEVTQVSCTGSRCVAAGTAVTAGSHPRVVIWQNF